MNYMDRYQLWVDKAQDDTVVSQLRAMQGDDKAIQDAFFQEIAFGTAGLRGVMGAGSNCLNYYTIMRATQGLANYMTNCGMTTAGITFDSRLNSQYYAELVAQVLATNNISCYITRECQPTPFLSFIVRQLHCDIGVNITASHNPSQYNGYKVYDNNGCQLLDDDANKVTQYINQVDAFDVAVKPLQELSSKINYIGSDIEDQYINTVLRHNLNAGDSLSVVYTPLNGSGYKMVPRVLQDIGVEHLHIVQQQDHPDGNFVTCKYPNPEKKEALTLAIELANKLGSDIVVATDPDCDRVGVAVQHQDSMVILTGNEVGILLCDYILTELKKHQQLPQQGIVVKTIVTSTLVDKIAQDNNVEVVDVLTGFKYIGDAILQLEDKGQSDRYIFGFEESCGYLRGTYVRDKDAVVASMLVCEMASLYKKEGITLVDRLEQLYNKYGTYQHVTHSYEFGGASGAEKKQQLLAHIQSKGLTHIGDRRVDSSVDYSKGVNGLPKADVFKYTAKDGTQLILRPSGTEPLIKAYVTVCGTKKDNDQLLLAIKEQLDQLLS